MKTHDIAASPSSTSGDPLGPRPVSAKAVYRLADKLDLPALKLRAFQHIIGDLTSQNVPAEVFSRFSSTFEDVRKVSRTWADDLVRLIGLTLAGPSRLLPQALDGDQEERHDDADLATD
jgi:hypothetical protein